MTRPLMPPAPESDAGDRPPVIAVVGGGFSGTLVAVHLLKAAVGPLHVVLLERQPPAGRGIAYGAAGASHLLNVPAGKMSALPDAPGHFMAWLARRAGAERTTDPSDFVSRRLYGAYISELLAETVATVPPDRILTPLVGEAIGLEDERGRALLHIAPPPGSENEAEGAYQLVVDRVVLALGHFPPAHPSCAEPALLASPRYVGDPWSPRSLAPLAPGEDEVLLVGAGLTALDLALAFADADVACVHLVSRRGFMPQAHRSFPPYPPFLTDRPAPLTVAALLDAVRQEVARAAHTGSDWRAVIDALRPETQTLWQALPLVEQRRFLRHLRPFWEVHRHRVAPRVAAAVAELQDHGRLCLHAGRLATLEADAKGVTVTVTTRQKGKQATRTLRVARVINCTGPECDTRRMRHPLVADLVGQGLLRPDALALGLGTSPDGALLDADARPSPWLFTLGPLRKGQLWETTAVPELRVQARDLALTLLAGL